MLPILWRAEAQSDFTTILEYFSERSPQSALELCDDIERMVSELPQHPYLYRLGRLPGTRELVFHPNYLVVYRVSDTSVDIVAVLHSRQQYPCPMANAAACHRPFAAFTTDDNAQRRIATQLAATPRV
jgi:toxin ParE1/3/4